MRIAWPPDFQEIFSYPESCADCKVGAGKKRRLFHIFGYRASLEVLGAIQKSSTSWNKRDLQSTVCVIVLQMEAFLMIHAGIVVKSSCLYFVAEGESVGG